MTPEHLRARGLQQETRAFHITGESHEKGVNMAKVDRYIYEYEPGSSAHVLVPQRDYERRQEEERRERFRREKDLRRRQANLRRRNRASAIGTMLLVGIAMVTFAGILYLQSSIAESAENITALRAELSSLRAENAVMAGRIHAGTDLIRIRQVACEELGMVPATAQEIIYYNVNDRDFMTVYE